MLLSRVLLPIMGHQFCIPPKKQFGIEDKNVLEDINNTIYDIFELGEFEQKLLPNSMVRSPLMLSIESLCELSR